MSVTNTDWSTPNNTISLSPLQPTLPSEIESRNSGGTAHILPNERKKATINVETLTNVLDGGPEKTKKRRFILSPSEGTDQSGKYYMTPQERFKSHIEHFTSAHDEYLGKYIPTVEEVSWMSCNTMNGGTLSNHFGLFLPTVMAQASEEQLSKWLSPTYALQIIGAYAQTELGHGSNVRGIRTVAHYDQKTQEFVLNTPTLPSIKWWPGALGKIATHAMVYAQLILDGKEHGVQAFLIQIRDENHRPLPGIEVGDLGPKLGDHANDTGFLRLDNFRIPRENMLDKNQQVTPEGKFVTRSSGTKNPKAHYATMMLARTSIIMMAGGYLARAVTIAIRYSCVRRQGFIDTSTTHYLSPERQIIDHQVQQYRLFKQLAIAYAFKFSGLWMSKRQQSARIGDSKEALQDLKEIAATAAGLKGLCTYMAWEGIEDCRKCCGGNGYLMASGIAPLAQDYVWQTTAEGDYILMILQLGRFLIGIYEDAVKGVPVSEQCDYLSSVSNPNFNALLCAPVKPISYKDFLNPNYLLSYYKYRVLMELMDTVSVYKKKLAEGCTRDSAFNACAVGTISAVRAHCFYFILRNFITSINEVKDQDIKLVLNDLCSLFGTCLLLDDNWTGCISREQFVWVKQANSELLSAIRPNAVTLVDAFDIPDRVLCSAIGNFDGNVYEALFESAKKGTQNQVDPYIGYKEIIQPKLDVEFLKNRSKL